jgi:hypothetical protein
MTAAPQPWHLLDDETILWTGQPQTGWMLTARDVPLIPFGAFFLGFSVFWEVQVFSGPNPPPVIFKLWGIPFILVGLFGLVGRFPVDAYIRSKTRYAVTDQRILISRSPPFQSLTSLSLAHLPELRLVEHRNGRGSIHFGAESPVNNRNWGVWLPSLDPTPRFLGIDNAAELFSKIQQQARQASRRVA